MKFNEKRKVIQAGLLALLTVAVFGNSFTSEFVWDDTHLIMENRYIRSCKNIPLFFTPHYWNDLHPSSGVYRPLRTSSFAVDYFLWKLNPTGYRLMNVLLHTINTLLFYCLVSFFGRQGADNPADNSPARSRFFDWPLSAAAFFAVHPIHTESINLVKNRSDLLAAIFFLLSFLVFVKYVTCLDQKHRRLGIFGAWMCFIPALLSKEMALTLPGVLALYAVIFLPSPGRKKALFRLIPYGVIILVYFWFMTTFIETADSPPAVPFSSGSVRHVLTVIKTIGIYLKMLAVPYPLNADHAFTIPGSVFDSAVPASLAALMLVVAATVGTYRRAPMVCFSLGWILLTLMPAANLVFLVSRPIAEQRLYIPSFGFCLLLGYGTTRLTETAAGRWKRGRPAVAGRLLSAMIVILFAGLVTDRNLDWRDEITFYTRTLAANPDSARMHNNLGFALSKKQAYDKAIGHYFEALRLQPDFIKALNNLGEALIETGRIDDGIQYHEKAFRLQPGRSNAWFSMGFALYKAGRYEEALMHYEAALRLQPDNLNTRYNMGLVLYELGRYAEAISHYRAALKLAPDYVDAHINLGLALSAAHRSDEAITQFLTAISLDPESVEAHINLGAELSEKGRLEEAARYYEAALKLDPRCAQAWNNLGALLLKAGRFEEAVEYLTQAVRLDPDYPAALKNLAQALLLAGRVEAAVDCYQAALKIMPDNADIYYHLGMAAMIRNNSRQAAKFLKQVLEIDPDHVNARQAYAECLEQSEPSLPGERP